MIVGTLITDAALATSLIAPAAAGRVRVLAHFTQAQVAGETAAVYQRQSIIGHDVQIIARKRLGAFFISVVIVCVWATRFTFSRMLPPRRVIPRGWLFRQHHV
jgi:hypothetical protein